ncbi:hypothetical protein [Pelagicoccus mobilis]|uniref:Uncharacterized protein n=1 Tax=Pelagicoccus mobilis TaxID=415221 RepID=A0A934S6Q2_9BACT|nr:hypothetical protein [Pelagicoccus mobilis]MBK1880737.1 hypothetical protein [Pelagicoccus mobilis]
MELTLQDLKHLNFHDGTLESVEEVGSHIRMSIDSGAFGPPLDGSEGKQWIIRDCVFECFGVTRNEKELWKDTKEPSQFPDGSLPIDEILNEDIKNDCYEMSGFHENQDWAVWRIQAQKFKLTYQTKTEFKIR